MNYRIEINMNNKLRVLQIKYHLLNILVFLELKVGLCYIICMLNILYQKYTDGGVYWLFSYDRFMEVDK